MSTRAIGKSGGTGGTGRTNSRGNRKEVPKETESDFKSEIASTIRGSEIASSYRGSEVSAAPSVKTQKSLKKDPFADFDEAKANAMITKGEASMKKKELLEDVLEDGDVDFRGTDDILVANITEVDEQL